MNDIPDQCIHNLANGTNYLFSSQYTPQWLTTENPILCGFFPNNSDATFKSHHKPKPSGLLLHSNYDAATVKHWGRNQDVLSNHPGLPHP
jgi:hypothetical protein